MDIIHQTGTQIYRELKVPVVNPVAHTAILIEWVTVRQIDSNSDSRKRNWDKIHFHFVVFVIIFGVAMVSSESNVTVFVSSHT